MRNAAANAAVLLAIACASFATTPLGADTITVGPDASRFDYTDIQSAIDSASTTEFTIIKVAEGTYTGSGDSVIDYRGTGLASECLARLERLAREHQIEFLMLFADDARLYTRNGYHRASNHLSWLKIHEHANFGIGEDVLEELMVKQLGERAWPTGRVDLLGYQL